jgi:hypothetical protein
VGYFRILGKTRDFRLLPKCSSVSATDVLGSSVAKRPVCTSISNPGISDIQNFWWRLVRARRDRFDIPLFGAKQTPMPNTIASQLCARESALHRELLSLCENPLKPFANVL